MQIVVNPYRWDQVNIDLFYGRDALRLELVSKLRDGQSFGITGGRRMGKTTLLRRIEADLIAQREQWLKGGLLIIPIYLDTLALSYPITADSIFELILQRVEDNVRNIRSRPKNKRTQYGPLHPFAAQLASLIDRIPDYRSQVIILFDEVEPIRTYEWSQAFFANWRAFLHNEPVISPHISAAFAGASEMLYLARDIGSPLGNVLTWRELALFSFEDTALLVNEPTNNCLPPELTEQIFRETGGHPFLIQYIMRFVWERSLDEPLQSLEIAVEHFLNYERDKFERWWEQLSSVTQQLYGQLIQSEELTPRRRLVHAFREYDINRALDILCHTGIATFFPEQDAYGASGRMFSQWFLRYGSIDHTLDLADQVDQLLKELERSLRGLLKKHLEQKYGMNWPTKRIAKLKTKTRNGVVSLLDAWCINAKRQPGSLGAEEALFYAELGDLFLLVITEWGDLQVYFRFSRDPGKDKVLFDERKDVLLSTRNALRHVREETVQTSELLKAQAFCVEILDQIRNSRS